MSFAKLEYIWLDGHEPTQELRSKTKIEEDFSGKLEDCPLWSFDGSSTEQAEGGSSDCLLKPVAIYPDPERAIFSKFADASIPRSYVVNKNGKIIFSTLGFNETSFNKVVSTLDNLLQ